MLPGDSIDRVVVLPSDAPSLQVPFLLIATLSSIAQSHGSSSFSDGTSVTPPVTRHRHLPRHLWLQFRGVTWLRYPVTVLLPGDGSRAVCVLPGDRSTAEALAGTGGITDLPVPTLNVPSIRP